MRKARSLMAGVLCLSSIYMVMTAAPAHARPQNGASYLVTGDVVDAWRVVGNSVNALLADTRCSVTASTPVQDANLITGSGAVSCNRQFAKISLTVCVQAKQAFAAEEATWQNIGCGPEKVALNSSGLTQSATAACVPGNMLYRTHVEGKAFRAETADPAFAAIITSNYTLKNCGVA